MNALMKAVLRNPESQSRCFQLRSAFFHSTPFLHRARRNNSSNSRFSNNYKYSSSGRNRFRGHRFNDSSAYVNYLFQSWESDFTRDEEPSNKGPSWFRRSNHGARRNGQGHQNKGRRGFSFCEDIDYEADETVFRSAFGDRFFVWSYVDEGYSNGKHSSRRSKSHKSSWRRGNKNEDEYHYTPKEDTQISKLASERTALGLSASGPLKLEDVKTAYRASALKWHPDRHQGSSKAKAEEKFKHCTSAYQSLCDSLAVN